MKGAWFCGINSNTYSLYYKALRAGSFLVRFLSLVPFRVEIWFSVIGKANVYRFVYSKSVFYNMQHFTETEIICKKLPFFNRFSILWGLKILQILIKANFIGIQFWINTDYKNLQKRILWHANKKNDLRNSVQSSFLNYYPL